MGFFSNVVSGVGAVADDVGDYAAGGFAEDIGADKYFEADRDPVQYNTVEQKGTAPQSFVMPTYGGWSNLNPGTRGQQLQQTGQMTFQGPATDQARAAIDGSLGGQTRASGGAAMPTDTFVDAGPVAPGPSQPRQQFTQQPGMQLSQQQNRPLVDPTLWRMSQGRI